MRTTKIVNANIVNDGEVRQVDILIKGHFIERVGGDLSAIAADQTVDASGNYVLPGAIDDQVHFREPGLTHKASIFTESRAAVAGGVTSFMEMPNTVPAVFTQELLEQKFQIAAKDSLANFSFFMGAANDNLDEVMKTDITKVCGLKIFMGSSTGNLLVDDEKTLETFFSRFPTLIATHCEYEPTIRKNTADFKERYGEDVPIEFHPLIRSAEGCYQSSSMAVALAKKHGTKLHVLHISTARELELFDNSISLEQKRVTAEACIHHLWFTDEDYKRLGTLIKWNPAVKTVTDRNALLQAVLDDKIDVIATDHAPHTLEEKGQSYFKAPSGGPLVQHSLVAMLQLSRQGKISIEQVVTKMAHNPARLFEIDRRGFIREGYFADLVMVDLNRPWRVQKSNILAKCGWSPFEGLEFNASILKTWVSGNLVFDNGKVVEGSVGQRLLFKRR